MLPSAGAATPRVSLAAIFFELLKVASLASGGGLVWAHRFIVERRQWLTEAEFADILSVCQIMPGPNMIGVAVCVGAKLRGLPGAIAGFAGFTVIPGTLGFCLAVFYLQHTGIPLFQNILVGVSATAAGLTIGTGLRFLRAHRFRPMALGFAAAAWAGIVIGKFPLLVVLLGLAPLSIAAAVVDRARLR